MDHTFSDCLLQILLVRGPGVGRALPHDLVLFLLPAAVACTEMDSSEYIHGSKKHAQQLTNLLMTTRKCLI